MDWKQFLFGTESVPATKIKHEQLGEMVFDDPFWRGQVTVSGQTLDILIDDDGKGVNEVQAEYCLSVLEKLEEFLKNGLALISSETNLSAEELERRFTATDLWGFHNANETRHFYISFSDYENEFACWFVQFDNEIARYAGFDT